MTGIFDGLSATDARQVKAAGTAVRLPADWSPIHEKTPAYKAYILLSGAASVRRGGREVATLGPGDVFGEAGLVNHKLRNASIVTTTPVQALHFTAEQLGLLRALFPRSATPLTGRPRTVSARRSGRRGEEARALMSGHWRRRRWARPCGFTRVEVCAMACVPFDEAEELWQHLGFPRAADDDVAFTETDVEALTLTPELVALGVLKADTQAALVRTWGRSYARLAEWQAELLTVAVDGDHPSVNRRPRREGAAEGRAAPGLRLATPPVRRERRCCTPGRRFPVTHAVAFADIVGYTGRSHHLTETGLVAWVEGFEDPLTRASSRRGPGDQDYRRRGPLHRRLPRPLQPRSPSSLARGEDPEDDFPRVRAGIAYGEVVTRLGDVFGPTVNLAARLTSIARPGTVIVDRGAFDALTPAGSETDPHGAPTGPRRGGVRRRPRLPPTPHPAYLGEGLLPPRALGGPPSGDRRTKSPTRHGWEFARGLPGCAPPAPGRARQGPP